MKEDEVNFMQVECEKHEWIEVKTYTNTSEVIAINYQCRFCGRIKPEKQQAMSTTIEHEFFAEIGRNLSIKKDQELTYIGGIDNAAKCAEQLCLRKMGELLEWADFNEWSVNYLTSTKEKTFWYNAEYEKDYSTQELIQLFLNKDNK